MGGSRDTQKWHFELPETRAELSGCSEALSSESGTLAPESYTQFEKAAFTLLSRAFPKLARQATLLARHKLCAEFGSQGPRTALLSLRSVPLASPKSSISTEDGRTELLSHICVRPFFELLLGM